MRKQIHPIKRSFVCESNYVIEFPSVTGKKLLKDSFVIPVDQFFAQPHNLHNGCIDTSPVLLDNPNNQGHFMPLKGESFPSSMSYDDIHKTLISKSCQTPSEMASLINSMVATKQISADEAIEIKSVNDDSVDSSKQVENEAN